LSGVVEIRAHYFSDQFFVAPIKKSGFSRQIVGHKYAFLSFPNLSMLASQPNLWQALMP
jgi:hypothetical protein